MWERETLFAVVRSEPIVRQEKEETGEVGRGGGAARW